MKALRRLRRESHAAEIQNVPVPEIDAEHVLVNVSFCGICGSDLHTFLNHAGYESVLPEVTLGHEMSGIIEAVGENVTDYAVGQAVTMLAIQSHSTAEESRFIAEGLMQLDPKRRVQGLHLDGGMAEYIAVDQAFVVPLPKGLDLKAAALTEPLSIAEHCVYHRATINPGDMVVVTGPGIIGMLCAVLAKHKGADVLISGTASDVEHRLSTADRIGLKTAIVGPDQPSLGEQVQAAFGRKADTLIEASGAPPALATAWQAVRANGSVTVVSIFGRDVTMDITQFIRKQIDIRTSYGSARANFEHCLELLSAGAVPADELVRVYPLADGIQAFIDAEKQEVMKPMLDCS